MAADSSDSRHCSPPQWWISSWALSAGSLSTFLSNSLSEMSVAVGIMPLPATRFGRASTRVWAACWSISLLMKAAETETGPPLAFQSGMPSAYTLMLP